MGRIDCRTASRRRIERTMWALVYALMIGCGAMLGYLGLWSPEKSLAADEELYVPPPPRAASLDSPQTEAPADPAGPDEAAAATPNTFFGIPVE